MNRFLRIFFLVSLLSLVGTGGCSQEGPPVPLQVLDVAPIAHPDSLSEQATRDEEYQFMLDSYRKVGSLHTMVLCGDFQQLIDIQHWGIMLELERRESTDKPRRHGCSMFQHRSGEAALLGRNFDHKYSEMLVAWCYPDSGFASLGFVPLNQWGFTDDNPFDPENDQHRRALLSGPATVIEGMNQMGVTVTLASLDSQPVEPVEGNKPRFLIHLVREILDHAGNLEEAIALASGYDIFDNGKNVITHHILLSDPEAGSAVLEWHEGKMEVLRSGLGDQVVTNRPLYDRGEGDLRSSCWRYRTVAKGLENAGPGFDWESGMNLLAQAAQHNVDYVIQGERWRVSTQWSAIFDMTAREAYISWGRDYGQAYRFEVPVSGR